MLKGEPLLTPWAVIQPASSAGTALDWLVVRYACQFKIQLVVDRGSLFTVTWKDADVRCSFGFGCLYFIAGKLIYHT